MLDRIILHNSFCTYVYLEQKFALQDFDFWSLLIPLTVVWSIFRWIKTTTRNSRQWSRDRVSITLAMTKHHTVVTGSPVWRQPFRRPAPPGPALRWPAASGYTSQMVRCVCTVLSNNHLGIVFFLLPATLFLFTQDFVWPIFSCFQWKQVVKSCLCNFYNTSLQPL